MIEVTKADVWVAEPNRLEAFVGSVVVTEFAELVGLIRFADLDYFCKSWVRNLEFVGWSLKGKSRFGLLELIMRHSSHFTFVRCSFLAGSFEDIEYSSWFSMFLFNLFRFYCNLLSL